MLAVFLGHQDIVELLLNAYADINKADKYGRTPRRLAFLIDRKI
jgi:ankyrin repeat protein